MDILGSTVMSLNTNEILTSYFEKGIYIISIEFLDGRITENKLIIN